MAVAPCEGESPTGTGLTSQWAFCESGGSGGLEPFGVVNSALASGGRKSEVDRQVHWRVAAACHRMGPPFGAGVTNVPQPWPALWEDADSVSDRAGRMFASGVRGKAER